MSSELDRDGRVALYVQIADDLHAAIDAGDINGRMPTMEVIAREFKVARNTAAAALRLLRDEQVIEFSPGHGYYSLPAPHPGDLKAPAPLGGPAPAREARRAVTGRSPCHSL